jgi:hypothetical protein
MLRTFRLVRSSDMIEFSSDWSNRGSDFVVTPGFMKVSTDGSSQEIITTPSIRYRTPGLS